MSERIRFTHRDIESLTPRPARYMVWDADRPGLALRVTPKGTKTFVYAYRFDGKARLHTVAGQRGGRRTP